MSCDVTIIVHFSIQWASGAITFCIGSSPEISCWNRLEQDVGNRFIGHGGTYYYYGVKVSYEPSIGFGI
ncbi:hypothetical protein SERLADRAFT_462241 [Serpula lacrymans var. lacrymans S7.9]|uniref:Uncharacterized protein n=1 Tax=Serpula lacrymans var. lacrymans (strain S7.9) TaxID=578457 RepID=F8NMW2_SERL9|nr:uncharacterized protein SERLADRAFT_462241 [Serpula lacrymans var. lacrymans S7.9]EGO27937.1 hypothetical protein SERLADRAFT_462241 [Serpula lacrymans var. lacrymans S7.9]